MRIDLAGEAVLLDPSGVLLLEAHGALVVADMHLEKGSAFARKGALLPPYDTLATLARLEELVRRHQPRRVVSLGDGFHDSAGARLVIGEAADRIERLARLAELVWIRGNHDAFLPSTLPGRIADSLTLGRIVLRHLPEPGAEPAIFGHLHPKARLVGRHRSLWRACFVSDGARLLMPAFGAYTGGLNILDPAIAGLFPDGFVTHVLGETRLHRPTMAQLCPDPADWRRHQLED